PSHPSPACRGRQMQASRSLFTEPRMKTCLPSCVCIGMLSLAATSAHAVSPADRSVAAATAEAKRTVDTKPRKSAAEADAKKEATASLAGNDRNFIQRIGNDGQ